MDNPKLNLISEFQKPDSVKQIDYAEVDRQNKQSENREEYFRLMFIALQNSARATRWYLQQWRID